MYDILDAIRDLLETNTLSSNTAAVGTTTTNITINSHGLNVGDLIINVTRASAQRVVTAIVDTNNFTVDAVTGQTSGDTITFPKFKRYYVGRIKNPPISYVPVLMVYGESTELGRSTTATDQYLHRVIIEIKTSAFSKVNTSEDADNILQAQKQIWDLMEERDSSNIPKSSTILGVLRRNIVGTKFKFHNAYIIEYNEEIDGNTLYFSGKITLTAVTQFNQRT